MNETDLMTLIEKGESQTIEHKKSLSLLKDGLEAICAMINSEFSKGSVLFGVAPNNIVCGVEPGNMDTAQRTIVQTIKQKFEPQLSVNLEVVQHEGTQVLVLNAERNRAIPFYEFDGRAWIREGTSNRQMTLTEKQNISRRRDRDSHQGPWKCDKCGSWVGMLASYIIMDEGMQKSYNCDCGGEYWPV